MLTKFIELNLLVIVSLEGGVVFDPKYFTSMLRSAPLCIDYKSKRVNTGHYSPTGPIQFWRGIQHRELALVPVRISG